MGAFLWGSQWESMQTPVGGHTGINFPSHSYPVLPTGGGTQTQTLALPTANQAVIWYRLAGQATGTVDLSSKPHTGANDLSILAGG